MWLFCGVIDGSLSEGGMVGRELGWRLAGLPLTGG
jgi:hypothetical protein